MNKMIGLKTRRNGRKNDFIAGMTVEPYTPLAYQGGCDYREGCNEQKNKTSEEFFEQCLGAGQGCQRASFLSQREEKYLRQINMPVVENKK